MISDAMIKQKGFDILKENLGLVEMERFIVLINRERFDYTKWRQELFEDLSLEELSEKANEFSKSL